MSNYEGDKLYMALIHDYCIEYRDIIQISSCQKNKTSQLVIIVNKLAIELVRTNQIHNYVTRFWLILDCLRNTLSVNYLL